MATDDVFQRRNSPYWQCWCRVIDASGRRKRVARSTGVRIDAHDSRKLARINAAELLRGLATRPETVTRKRKTLRGALRALTEAAELAGRTYHTLENIMHRGVRLAEYFGADKDLHEITADDLREYAVWSRKVRGVYTVHRELVVLWSSMRISGVSRPEFPDLGDISHKPQRVLELDEQRRLLMAVAPHRRLNLLAYLQLGLRRSEPWKIIEIDWDSRYVQVQGTKRKKDKGRPRLIPIPEGLYELMLERRHEWPVFLPLGKLGRGADHMIRRAGRRAGLGNELSVNDLRGTYATWMARSGVDALTLAGIMGNSPAMLASVYAQVNLRGDHLHAAAERGVPRLISPSKKKPIDKPEAK